MSSFGSAPALIRSIREEKWTAGRLAAERPAIPESTTCADFFASLREDDLQSAAAVVDGDGRVIGLVDRLQFVARYVQQFIPEAYGERRIMALANAKPLVVDEATPISELAATVPLDDPGALRGCFVVTRGGRYFGIASGEALVRAKLELLRSREKQLNAALTAAEAADAVRRNFLASMSHELRTPLNAIIGFSEVLAQELYGPHSIAKYGEYARDIHGAGRHLLALINDILDLSKSEAGQLELYCEPVDVDVLLRECARLLAGRAADGKVLLHINVPGVLPFVSADALRIKQVVLNLLSNAVKFTLPGGKVDVSAAVLASGAVEITIADTGIGMEPAMIPVALEPFRQVASALSRKVEGTGLGLSLAKSLAERHGGTLTIESALHKGTAVRLQLPPERTIWVDEAKSA
jgi:two-component system cell cycle sensor histidine kinase PleC